MYNDILFNGSRRFAVTSVDPETGKLAEVGVIFYLDDLKEVSEQTGDAYKFIGTHKVQKRIKIHQVLNPKQWQARETYLKAEVEELVDDDEGVDCSQEESALESNFRKVVELQGSLKEDVSFTSDVVFKLSRDDEEGQEGFWTAVRLWQNFLEQRLGYAQRKMQKEIQDTIVTRLIEDKGKDNIPSVVRFEELSPQLQKELTQLQKSFRDELESMITEPYVPFQRILQGTTHKGRIDQFSVMIDKELKRLQAKSTLKSMFSK